MIGDHVEANKLLDIAETGDRQKYRAALDDLHKRTMLLQYQRIKDMAFREHRSNTRDHRFSAWRAEWNSQKKAIAG